jgi:pyruvate dehydrogenase E1 component
MAVIVGDGLHRMYEKQEDVFYYITMMNEFYQMPTMPEGVKEGILKGMYRFKAAEQKDAKARVTLMGSGTILNEAVKAQQILNDKYKIAADVYSVTSYKELYTDAISTTRWNMLHPSDQKKTYIEECVSDAADVFVAATDYLKALPCSISQWIPGRLIPLGTDGFGRSDDRPQLREYFEVDARFITLAALYGLFQEGKVKKSTLQQAIAELDIDPEKVNPVMV